MSTVLIADNLVTGTFVSNHFQTDSYTHIRINLLISNLIVSGGSFAIAVRWYLPGGSFIDVDNFTVVANTSASVRIPVRTRDLQIVVAPLEPLQEYGLYVNTF